MTDRDQALAVRNVFKLDVPMEVMTAGFAANDSPFIPKLNDGYVFRRELLRDILAFLDDPDGDGMFFAGYYGAGKTSLPYQVAARLNWSLQSYTAHDRMEFDDLVGTWKMTNGTMEFIYGPLAVAMMEGHIFVINEVDCAGPGQLVGLHDVIEGQPLVIATNGGQIIHAHENFRIMATGNSVGSGDNTGLHQGVQQQNIAFMDRFRVIEVDYPEEQVELSILEKKCPDLPLEIRTSMVKVANSVRKLFVGGEEIATPLTITMSTRTLCRWAKLTQTFRKAPNAISYALNQALLSKAEPEQRIAITEIAKATFGDNWS